MERPKKVALRQQTQPPSTATKVRIGFAPDAREVFDHQLNDKERQGILRKLRDVALNSRLAKPLTGKLRGCSRATYGRIRFVFRHVDEIAVVVVLVIGRRKPTDRDDVYRLAIEAHDREDFNDLLEKHIRSFVAEIVHTINSARK